MKGISEEFGVFLKVLEVIFMAITLLAVFFSVTHYSATLELNQPKKEVLLVSESVMGAPCLMAKAKDSFPIKAFFDEVDVNRESASITNQNPSCLSYNKNILVSITEQKTGLIHEFGYRADSNLKPDAISKELFQEIPAVLKKTTGDIVPVIVTIYVG